MDNKEYVDAGKVTKKLILYWILFSIPAGIIYKIIIGIISAKIDSYALKAIIAVALQGGVTYLLWIFSTSYTFQRVTMSFTEIPKVMKNLIIFTVIICLITAVWNFIDINASFDKAINQNSQLKIYDTMAKRLYSDKKMAEYNKQKEEAINKAKQQLNIYLIILEIGVTAVYLGVLPLEKRELKKYVC